MKDGGVEHSQFPHVLTELEKPGTWAKHEYKNEEAKTTWKRKMHQSEKSEMKRSLNYFQNKPND